MSNDGRHLLAGGTGDLLRQMHRMRHQDHKDEGLNLTRSMLAGRTSKINNRTKARFIRMKKAAAPPKPSKKPKRIPAPVADGDAASGAAPGPEAPSLDLGDGEYDEWTDEDFADDFNDDDYLEDILKDCAKDNTIALFSCSEKYADMCKVAKDNLDAMGIGHLALASSEDVCDSMGYDDFCCTVAENVMDMDSMGPSDSMYTVRWQYLEIALGFKYNVILQDCDVLWTKNPVDDFKSDPEVGIIGLREKGTKFPFNAGLTWFRADRAAVMRVVRDVNERLDFLSGVEEEPYRLDEIGLDQKCIGDKNSLKRLIFDQAVYNDALESSALNDDVYTRSRFYCDPDGRDTKFQCIEGFSETGCMKLEPEFGSGDGYKNFKERNGKLIKCTTDPDATPEDDAKAEETAPAEEPATTQETEKQAETPTDDAAPAAEESSSSDSDATSAAEESSSSDSGATPAAEESASSDSDAASAAEESASPEEEAPAQDDSTAAEESSSSEEEAPAQDDSTTAEESTVAAEEAAEEGAQEVAERRRRTRRLLSNPRRLRAARLHRRAVLQEEAEAASSEASPASDEVDFSERPAKACIAADDILASWLWSGDKSGKEGAWSMKTPVAMGYHFVGTPFGNDADSNVNQKVTEMKKVLEN